MTLLEIANTINFVLGERRPEQPTLTPKRFSELLHVAQLKHYKRKLGLPEEYQVGMPLPRQVYDVTQKITEDMRAFKVNMDGSSNALQFTDGVAMLPFDYYYPSSMAAFINYDVGTYVRPVIIVTDQRWDEMHGNFVDVPSDEYPIANFQTNSVRIAPKEIRLAKFIYLRMPNKPEYKVTVSGNKNIYDPVNSVQLEWDEINQLDIMYVMLADLGLPMLRQDVFQIAEKHKQQGI